jgi:hypothetical protein
MASREATIFLIFLREMVLGTKQARDGKTVLQSCVREWNRRC